MSTPQNQTQRKKISTKEELVEFFKSLNLDFEEGDNSLKVRGEVVFVKTEIPWLYIQQNNIRLGFERYSKSNLLVVLVYPDIYTETKILVDLDKEIIAYYDKPFMIFRFPMKD
jgi:hypothetical protein